MAGHWVQDPTEFRGHDWLQHYSEAVTAVHRAVNPSVETWQGGPQWGPYRYLCSARLNGTDLPRVKTLASWHWSEGGALMRAVEPNLMAKLIRRAPVRFLGDSLMGEMFSSMIGLLGRHVVAAGARTNNGSIVVPLRDGGSIRYDPMHRLVHAKGTRVVMEAADDYPILVLDSTMPLATNKCATESDLGEVISQHFHGSLVFYVAANPTHPDCAGRGFESFHTQPTGAKPSVANMTRTQLFDYHRWCWNKISDNTESDVRSLRAHLGDRLVVLNMTDATDQRPDSHSIRIPGGRCCDCMHHCLPGGPIETWNDALFGALTSHSASRVHT